MPPIRKGWMSEDYRMRIFDAGTFGTTIFKLEDNLSATEFYAVSGIDRMRIKEVFLGQISLEKRRRLP